MIFKDEVRLKNARIFAKSDDFESPFNQLYVYQCWVKSGLKFQGVIIDKMKLKNARIFAKSDDF
jgi:hypothetical protein